MRRRAIAYSLQTRMSDKQQTKLLLYPPYQQDVVRLAIVEPISLLTEATINPVRLT
jgi:hypothetical protein